VARAQQAAMPVIGWLSGSTENSGRATTPSFHRGPGEWGYVEGRNVEILYRWAEFQYDRLPALAAELVRDRVAVIVTSGGPATHLAAKSATPTIPIVFATGADPVEFGLVASLNRPGGNVTGVTWLGLQLVAKRLELLHEIVPAVTSIGHLVNPTTPTVGAEMREAENAARVLGLRLVTLNASNPGEIEGAFATLIGQRIGAFLQGADPLFVRQRAQLAALATRYAVPAIHISRETVAAGWRARRRRR
jgi:putative ABC transport system substrate-binding protein